MAMKKIVTKYDKRAEFVVGDHYVNIKKMHSKATESALGIATQVGDRYIVKAGALYSESGSPIGLVYRDTDVTDGDAMMAVCVHAVIDESALPAAVSKENKAALKGLIFV